MNSLLGYGSDDDYDSPEEKQVEYHSSTRNFRKPSGSKQDDANYDEVQMSLSEDSNDESKSVRDQQKGRYRDGEGNHSDSDKSDYRSRKERTDRREDRYSRDDDRNRDRYREKDEERSRDRRDDRRGKSRERNDRYRDRKDRDRRRSRSRERDRRRSRSPRRSRSRSKDRGRGYLKRFDRANTKTDKMDSQKSQMNDDKSGKDRFFMPGITGRFRDQIEKRKLLWQKKEPEVQPPNAIGIVAVPGGSRTTKVWEATTFAQDTDGKVANKFKRLMGIRNAGEGSNTAVDVLKKQEEMFSSMEQQYEVARTATHTMRGVGLGFGSYQR